MGRKEFASQLLVDLDLEIESKRQLKIQGVVARSAESKSNL